MDPKTAKLHRNQRPQKESRKRGRAWVVVTPAASLVEPPSRCRRTARSRGGRTIQNDAFRGFIQEPDMEKLSEVNLKKKIDQKKLGAFEREGHCVLNV